MSRRNGLNRSTYIALIISAVVVVLCMIAVIIALALRTSITDISIPQTINLDKGGQMQLVPEFTAVGNKSDQAVEKASEKIRMTWESSNSEVVSVDDSGFIRALAGGDTYITLSAELSDRSVRSICHVYVNVPFDSLEAPDAIELVINYKDSSPVGARLIPDDSTGIRLTYSSINPAVAEVDANGIVSAVSEGICSIIVDAVSSKDPSEVIATRQVRVIVTVAPLAMTAQDLVLSTGQQGTFTLLFEPENVSASSLQLTYINSNQNVCTVDKSGIVYALAPGSSTVIISDQFGHTCSAQVLVAG